LYKEIKSFKNITVFTGTTVDKVSGSLGNFHVDVRVKPRFINGKADKQAVSQALEECPVYVYDDFNLGLSKRKAIYKNYPEAFPDVPVVDAEALKNETDFLNKFAPIFNLNEQEEVLSLIVGSVLVTTGYDSYQPKEGEYGYKTLPNVLTLPEFKRLMELSPEKLIFNDKQIRKIAFIYCVGNRQTKGENKYCSRQCCTSTIYTSLQLKEKYKDISTFHIYRDIRTYGKQEILYDQSSKQGDLYFKFEEKEPPVVEQAGKSLVVKFKDYLTAKMPLEVEADMVVLVTGMVAREDSVLISGHFKIPIGSDKFFNEIHPKLKPVETVIKGVYIGGSCQGPKNISESVQSSLSASAKINALLKSGKVSVDPVIARVSSEACTWCGKCAGVCDYTAIRETESDGKHIAAVNKAICTGCGICAPVCPVNAIEIAQYTDLEIESMIDGFTEEVEIKTREVSAEAAEETNGATMKEYPQIWKNILQTLVGTKKSIPQVAEEIAANKDVVTYHMMTMNKYSVVTAAGMDEKEEYYYYKIKNQ